MNTLITSVGRRAYLVDFFRKAMAEGDRLLGADCNPHAPALELFDEALLLPPTGDDRYAETLLRACVENEIELVVPINDLELPILARERARFAERGVFVLVSSPDVVDICSDKFRTAEFLVSHGFLAPRTFFDLAAAQRALEHGEISFPLLVKPRRGSASVGIVQVENQVQLEQEWNLHRRCDDIIQEHLGTGHYSLHGFSSGSGHPDLVIGLRVLYKTRGECYKAITVDDDELHRLGMRLGESLPMLGPWCVDVMQTPNGFVILEINPRIGGGYPVSEFAGGAFPRRIMALAAGDPVVSDPAAYEPGVAMLKLYTTIPEDGDWRKRRLQTYD